ncbi:MAG: radical SAM/SPASM domain-containing protein [Planctomycetaceae bacterium]|nr:radical SAM/SPASM domain-containing protein [Planctomycetaceae bacterium]
MSLLNTQLPILSQKDIELDRLVQETRDASLRAGSPSPVVDSCAAPARQEPPSWHPHPSESFGTSPNHLDWIDEFVANVRPYVRVRVEDGVLIKMPTEAFQVNRSGLALLERVMNGESIREILCSLGAVDHPERIHQIHTFFCDVRDLLSDRIGDGHGRPATRVARFEGSFTRYPVLSEIAVTYRCNLACTFCYAGCGTSDATPGNAEKEKHRNWWKFWRRSMRWQDRHQKRDPVQEEMTGEEVLRVIDQIAVVGKVPSVSFTGGECTLRPELPEFIAHARERGMRVNIITNGLTCASRDYVDGLVAAGLTSAQISLEGPDAEIHDALTQRPGSFSKTMRGLTNLRNAGLHVHTNTTICEENCEHLAGIIELAKSLKLPHVSMNHIIPTGTPNLARHEQTKISYTRIGEYVMRAKGYADRVGIDFHWYSPTPFCIFNPVAHGLGNKGCAACDGLVHVSPSGEVLPCSSFARGVGNVLEDGFDKVWFGKDAQYYKKKRQAHPVCKLCEHFELCQGACTLYWSGVGYEELYAANARRVIGGVGRLFQRS